MRRLPRGTWALALAGCLGVASRAQAPQVQPPNVLLLTLDTVRADRLGAYGYAKGSTPALDRLAREGVRFADATTQAPLTGPAHAALLTGRYPARFGVRDNATTPIPPEETTIAELFKAKGYRTGAFVGAFILGPEYGFNQGFDEFDSSFKGFDPGMKLQARRRGAEVVDRAITWIGGGGDPFFAWVHLYDAHAPYNAPAPYGVRFKTSPYDGEVAYVDACVGRLIAALEKRGSLDRTLVVAVADHGESLGEHGESEHGMFLYEPVLHIPWVMRLPRADAAGTLVKSQVRAIDVMPTIAALSGVEPPTQIDGRSVVSLIRGQTPRDPAPSYAETYYPKWHFGWSELKSVRVGDWKYIDAPRPELYDMRRDGAEQTNAVDARGPLAAGLSSELTKVSGSFGTAAAAEAVQPDPETLSRLRSLGYVGIASPSGTGRGPDPKDMAPKFEQFRNGISRAIEALDRHHPDAAIRLLKPLVAINERSYELHLFLGDAYSAKQQFDQALGEYAAAGVLNPRSGAPRRSSARVYLAWGDVAQALHEVEDAARLEPGSGEDALLRGMIYEKQGLGPQAFVEFDAAVRANGSDTQARARLASLAMRAGRFDVAGPQFEALLAMGYRPSRMHFGLGQIAAAQGDKKTAAAEYRRSLELEPGFTDARTALSKIGG